MRRSLDGPGFFCINEARPLIRGPLRYNFNSL